MNVSRARRRWRAWDRYLARLAPESTIPPGAWRSQGERGRWLAAKDERRRLRASAVDIADLLARLDRSRAAA